MPAFLTPAWIAELDAAGMAVDPGVTLDLDQVVTGTPEGDVRYRFTLSEGRLRVRTTADAPADATLTVDYDTAVALATGRLTGSDAFDAGLVRFRGDLAKMQGATAALAAIAEGLGVLRSRTTFGSGSAA